MSRMSVSLSTLSCVMVVTAAVYAQSHLANQSDQTPSQATVHASGQHTGASDVAEIFCPTMKTGQLCSHGTADTLELTGDKRDRWIEIARRYNRAVNAATTELLSESKQILTPAELRVVETWFAKGLNPQINQLLSAK